MGRPVLNMDGLELEGDRHDLQVVRGEQNVVRAGVKAVRHGREVERGGVQVVRPDPGGACLEVVANRRVSHVVRVGVKAREGAVPPAP